MGEPNELFATPADASRRADVLSDRWNALQNQAMGPAAQARPDVPPKLQEVIMSDRARFRDFIRSPTFGLGGALLPHGVRQGDYETLERWHTKYSQRAAQLAQALPGGERLAAAAAPPQLPGRDRLTWVSDIGYRVAVGVAVVGIVAALKVLFTGKLKSE